MAAWAKHVTGVDFHFEVMSYAQQSYGSQRPNLAFNVADATTLPFSSNSFEIVSSFELIEHLPVELVDRYVSEIRRVLMPGGICFITTPNGAYREQMNLGKYPFHEKEYHVSELQEILASHFQFVRVLGQRYIKQSLKGVEAQLGVSTFARVKAMLPKRLKREISRLLKWDRNIAKNWVISSENVEMSWGLLAMCCDRPLATLIESDWRDF